jgi:hypothetical protein
VSGPPQSLNCFADCIPAFENERKFRWLPIFVVYHAPHLHPDLNFNKFLSQYDIDSGLLSNFCVRKAVLSPSTGKLLWLNNALKL